MLRPLAIKLSPSTWARAMAGRWKDSASRPATRPATPGVIRGSSTRITGGKVSQLSTWAWALARTCPGQFSSVLGSVPPTGRPGFRRLLKSGWSAVANCRGRVPFGPANSDGAKFGKKPFRCSGCPDGYRLVGYRARRPGRVVRDNSFNPSRTRKRFSSSRGTRSAMVPRAASSSKLRGQACP